MAVRVIRLLAWVKADGECDSETLGEVFEFDACDRRTYKHYHSTIRSLVRSSERSRLSVVDPNTPWVAMTERQNRIEDAKVSLRNMLIHKSRLRAALSGNYDNVL